jgi:hypothetical protein
MIPSALQALLDRRTHDQLDSKLPAVVQPLGKIHPALSRISPRRMCLTAAQSGLGIASGIREGRFFKNTEAKHHTFGKMVECCIKHVLPRKPKIQDD